MDEQKELEKWMNDFRKSVTDEQREDHKRRFNEFVDSLNEDERKKFMMAFKDDLMNTMRHAKGLINEINIKKQLEDIQDVVSYSYIAEHYFGKSRQWLYQKINGSLVNGKPAKFSADELIKLKDALNDVGDIIKNTSRSIALP